MSWDDKLVEKFLLEYRKHECLWNPFHRQFHDCSVKGEALKEVVGSLQLGVGVQDCLRLLRCIREQYVEDQTRSLPRRRGSARQPRWMRRVDSMLEKTVRDEERRSDEPAPGRERATLDIVRRRSIPSRRRKCAPRARAPAFAEGRWVRSRRGRGERRRGKLERCAGGCCCWCCRDAAQAAEPCRVAAGPRVCGRSHAHEPQRRPLGQDCVRPAPSSWCGRRDRYLDELSRAEPPECTDAGSRYGRRRHADIQPTLPEWRGKSPSPCSREAKPVPGACSKDDRAKPPSPCSRDGKPVLGADACARNTCAIPGRSRAKSPTPCSRDSKTVAGADTCTRDTCAILGQSRAKSPTPCPRDGKPVLGADACARNTCAIPGRSRAKSPTPCSRDSKTVAGADTCTRDTCAILGQSRAKSPTPCPRDSKPVLGADACADAGQSRAKPSREEDWPSNRVAARFENGVLEAYSQLKVVVFPGQRDERLDAAKRCRARRVQTDACTRERAVGVCSRELLHSGGRRPRHDYVLLTPGGKYVPLVRDAEADGGLGGVDGDERRRGPELTQRRFPVAAPDGDGCPPTTAELLLRCLERVLGAEGQHRPAESPAEACLPCLEQRLRARGELAHDLLEMLRCALGLDYARGGRAARDGALAGEAPAR
ncbi:uncharacterized protein LOC131673325 [Phymastichus coffea]|uniref:uncharacterized protein LOC131673325 n=1 Tax=Phymastichus coffea TaxID=108790 RepID=UPI00273AB42C|nr:uncharacterized protein LOC131673325 [Phymastichus coffea]